MFRVIPVERAIIVFVASLAMIAGAISFVREMQVWSLLDLGEQIFKGRLLTEAATERILTSPFERTSGPVCRSDVHRAQLMIAVALRRTVLEKGMVRRVGAELQRLADVSRHVLTCNPADGFGWVQLAIARDQLGASTEEVRGYFEQSLWSAPSELWVIAVRLPAIALAGSRRDNSFGDLLQQDVRTLLSVDHMEGFAAEIMGPIFVWIEGIAQQEYARIEDPVRRDALLHAFGNWRANIAKCSREQFNDWQYRGMHGSCAEGAKIPDIDWKK